jgi:hypothetical protein
VDKYPYLHVIHPTPERCGEVSRDWPWSASSTGFERPERPWGDEDLTNHRHEAIVVLFALFCWVMAIVGVVLIYLERP